MPAPPARSTLVVRRRVLGLGVASALLAGCSMLDKLPLIGSAKKPPPAPAAPPPASPPPPQLVDVALEAAPGLNPDTSGRPSPVVVRLYQLKSAGKFANADFFALFDHDATLLGADLLAREDLDIAPAANRTVVLERAKDARQFAVLAAYRDVDSAHWRAVVDVWPANVKRFDVRLDALGVAVTPAAAAPVDHAASQPKPS
ncbi:type VI secretion system-associated lipoprotein [Paraburkholderia ginsengiterrae]|uniref:Type VI secretion system-associated lipoprotein n=1 Tax=Paraburkholderia ginsengiterrae TaxID=1462993 RepID=A0A1A9NCJ2_9BURK|nr:type VI secretion system lipoprotein TssJ [Paraburkholderia ginsengiterrae]OAJ58741.1 type VI secretion system-associated lipoprotein [Paraburkholderia ginsengiterrae]OAJ63617.1 type VI secretion system-associated lipoprotein [Paraburkholderia ginsengiterrae]